MRPIHRDEDDELCGFVTERDGASVALTVFGGVLGSYESEELAEDCVRERGLASLSERWTLTDTAADESTIVCLQEVDPTSVTVALDLFTYPGVPTRRISREELDTGRYVLRLDR